MAKSNNYFDIKWLVIAVTFTATVILFTHIPQGVMPTRPGEGVSGLDKLLHVVAYGVITFLFILSLKSSTSLLSALFLFFAISAIGIVDEATQSLVNRTASANDWLADIVGIMMALLFSKVYKHRFQKTKIA